MDNSYSKTEGMTDQIWNMILLSFLYDCPIRDWDEFANDLIFKNRFSSTHKIVEVVQSYADEMTIVIDKGQKLYRARKYRQDPLKEFVFDMYKQLNNNTNSIFANGHIEDYYNMKLAGMLMAIEKDAPLKQDIVAYYNKWNRKKFKGYKASESGMVPANRTSSGRINPEKIRCLYMAQDPQTCIFEVRPIIGQHVSVATFNVTASIKIYDLSGETSVQNPDDFNYDQLLLNEIQKRFSEPNGGDTIQYVPTQYLSETIKQMGFDGLRFRSSLRVDGYNVVLFDDKKCKAVKSDLVRVDGIDYKIANPDIYKLEEYL